MKKFIFLCLLASVFTLSLFTSNGIAEQQINSNEQIGKEVQSMSKNRIAVFETNMGTFEIELFEDKAPITTGNFIDLAEHNFYDGLIFHRVIDGFMIQGGDPKGDGTGGSKETIKGEFSDNGVKNPLSHTRGALSMARSQDNDSASSQFFIVQSDSTYLDGQYAVFGYVYEGMDIVDQICKDVKVEDNNGTVKKENQPVIESIRCKKI